MASKEKLQAALRSIEEARRDIEDLLGEGSREMGVSAVKPNHSAASDVDGNDPTTKSSGKAYDFGRSMPSSASGILKDMVSSLQDHRNIESLFGYKEDDAEIVKAQERSGVIASSNVHQFAWKLGNVLDRMPSWLIGSSRPGESHAERLRRHHGRFENLVAVMIFAHVLVLGCEAHVKAKTPVACPDPWLIVSITFDSVFCLEVIFRYFVDKGLFFTGREKYWNVFDTVVVTLGMGEDIVIAVVSRMACNPEDEMDPLNLNVVRMLRLLRLARFLKAVRFMTLIRDLRILASGVARCLRPFCWALLMTFFIVWSFSVVILSASTSSWQSRRLQLTKESFLLHAGTSATIGSSAHLDFASNYNNFAEQASLTEYEKEVIRSVFLYYSSLPGTMQLLLMSVTGGVDWNEGVQPLLYLECWSAAGIFMMYVIFVTLAFFNLITGLFVDRIVKEAQHDTELMIEDMIRHRKEVIGQALAVFHEFKADTFEIDESWASDNSLEKELFVKMNMDKDKFIKNYDIYSSTQGKMEGEDLDYSSPLDKGDDRLPLSCTFKGKELTRAEFEQHLQDEHVQGFLTALDLDPINAKRLFHVLDYDSNGHISQDEFVMGCMILRGPAKATDLAVLCKEFYQFQQKQILYMHQTSKQIDSLSSDLATLMRSIDSNDSKRRKASV